MARHRQTRPARPPRWGRARAAAICLLAMLACDPARAAGGPPIARSQAIVGLLAPHAVRATADVAAPVVALVGPARPITGARTTLPVLEQRTDPAGRSWLGVRLPGRALGAGAPPANGWILGVQTVASSTAWHLVVDLRTRRLAVYRDGRWLAGFPAIVGKPSTPTPSGEFFVEENIRLPANRPGGPFALATSARSPVLQEFDGGPGQIALHGLDNIGGQLGTAISHGCVRLADSSITWLAARIPPGTPVTVD